MGQIDWTLLDAATEKAAQEQAEAARQHIADRRAARRKKERRQRIAFTAAGMALTFGLGFYLGATTTGSRELTPTAPNTSPEVTATAPAYIAPHVPEATLALFDGTDATVTLAPLTPVKLLEAVPLDAETQAAIFDLCEKDPELFAAVMAIAQHESDFTPDAVGDGGDSQGMMQINTRWNKDRMEALGVTDLTNPVQCVTVALDVLKELRDVYGFGWVHDHSLYMAYNMGPGNARKALQNGQTSSAYSREVLPAFEGYLAEMEVRA